MDCERAREWASLGLDSELSQVEKALLRSHVGRCAACAAYVADLAGLTHEIRTSPLERPSESSLAQGWGARRAVVGRRLVQIGAFAAAVVVAAGLGGLAGSRASSSHTATAARGTARLTLLKVMRPNVRPAARPEQQIAV